jgi:hypothetical protein
MFILLVPSYLGFGHSYEYFIKKNNEDKSLIEHPVNGN